MTSWPTQPHHARQPEEIEAGITAAQQAIADGDAATAAYLTGIPEQEITRVEGPGFNPSRKHGVRAAPRD